MNSCIFAISVRNDTKLKEGVTLLNHNMQKLKILNFSSNLTEVSNKRMIFQNNLSLKQIENQIIESKIRIKGKDMPRRSVGFYSKQLSKYVLQNVMEFLYWKTDGLKVRVIC